MDTLLEQVFRLYPDNPDARRRWVEKQCSSSSSLAQTALHQLSLQEELVRERPFERLFGGREILPGDTPLGEYRVVRFLGGGAMGDVYLVKHGLAGWLRAIKILHSALHRDAGKRFVGEAQALERINSPYVIRVYDYVGNTHPPYLVMEYFEGTSLAALVAGGPPSELSSRLTVARQIALGLRDVHSAGVTHRDVKPSNVIVTSTGGVKLIDFGIAWRAESGLTSPGVSPGTPLYMAPEQFRGLIPLQPEEQRQFYQKVDVYAFGVLLFELLTGHVPFLGSREEVVSQILHRPVPLENLSPDVPCYVVDLVRACTEKNPGHRPANFSEVVSRFDSGPHQPARRNRKAVSAILVATLCLAAAVASYALRQPKLPSLPAAPQPSMPVSQPNLPLPAHQSVSAPAKHSPEPSPAGRAAVPPARLPVPSSSQPEPSNSLTEPPPNLLPQSIEASRITSPLAVPSTARPSPDEQAWISLRGTCQVDQLIQFARDFPSSPFSPAALDSAAKCEYDSVENTQDMVLLRRFAEKHLTHPLRFAALNKAHLLEADLAVRTLLDTYAARFGERRLERLDSLRQLTPTERQELARTFSDYDILQMTLTPQGRIQFELTVSGAEHPPAKATLPVRLQLKLRRASTRQWGQPRSADLLLTCERLPAGWKITEWRSP